LPEPQRYKVSLETNPGNSLKLTLIDREIQNPYPKHVTRKKIIARLLFNIRRQAQQGEVFTTSE